MANTYTQIYLHVVFSVKGRQNLWSPCWCFVPSIRGYHQQEFS